MLKIATDDQAKSDPPFAVRGVVPNCEAVVALPYEPSPSRQSREFGWGVARERPGSGLRDRIELGRDPRMDTTARDIEEPREDLRVPRRGAVTP
jgi:hypothetical protein